MTKREGYALIVFAAVAILAIFARPELASMEDMLLAQVGITVGVLPNQYNTLNAQLDQKAAQLQAQQAYINEEQAALASSTATSSSPANNPVLWYLTAAVAALIVLIVLNFYLDARRARREHGETAPPPAS